MSLNLRWKRYYTVAGTYNYKGQDFVVFYSYNKDGSMHFKRERMTEKSTDSHFFKDNKLTDHFEGLINI